MIQKNTYTMVRKIYFFAIIFLLLIPAFSISKEKSDKDLSEKHRKWLEEDVLYIITPTEKKVFSQLESDKEREMFIKAFWTHRDPTSGTQENEFKEELYRRIQYANYNLGRNTPGPGWKTDRGRMYIILGEPKDIERHTGEAGIYKTEVWFYQELTQYGLPPAFNLIFFQKDGVGEYVIYSPTMDGPQALMANYFGDQSSHLQAFNSLRKISPSLAKISMSLIPGESATSWQPSLSSDMLIQKIYMVAEEQFKDKYAEKFLLYKDIVEIDYTANYIESDFVVRVMKEPAGMHFIHYIIELNKFSIEQFQNKYVTQLEINGKVSDLKGKTIYQFERSIPVEFNKEQLDNITFRPFAFYDLFPMIPGDFKLSVLLKNEISKEFTSIEKDIFIPERITSPQISPLILGYDSNYDKTENMKPFKFAHQQIYSRPMRIFLSQDKLFVSFQVLGLNADLGQNAVLKFEILKNSEVILTSGKKLNEYQERLNFLEQFSLQDFSPGYYQIAVRLFKDDDLLTSASERFEITSAQGFPRPWVQNSSFFPLSHPGYSLIMGKQYFNKGEIDIARVELERAHQNQPDSQAISLPLANVYFIFKEYEKTKRVLLPFAESEDVKYGVLFLLGKTHHALGEFDKAIFLFDKAIDRFGVNIFLLNSLGDCYFNLGKLRDALAAWGKSLEIMPDQPQLKEKVLSIREKK
jgi:GWxTD domain-containing protein